MSKHNINIEHLQIRMRGISPETGRAAVRDLGHEILNQLTTTSGTGAVDLRQRIAKQVADSIKATKMHKEHK